MARALEPAALRGRVLGSPPGAGPRRGARRRAPRGRGQLRRSVQRGGRRVLRAAPRANVVYVKLPVGQDEISRSEFEAARAQVIARMPRVVQALALAWTSP